MPKFKLILTDTIIELLRDKNLAFNLLFSNKLDITSIPFSDIYPYTYIQSFEKAVDMLKIKINRQKENEKYFILNLYKDLARKLLKKVQNEIRLVCDDVEIFQLYSSYIDNLPIIIFKFNTFLDLDTSKIKLYGISNYLKNFNLYPFPPLKHRLTEISDLHFHLGGALKFNYRLQSLYLTFRPNTISNVPDDPYVKFIERDLSIENIILLLYILESLLVIKILNLDRKDIVNLDKYKSILENALDMPIKKGVNPIFFVLDEINKNINNKYFMFDVFEKLKGFNVRNTNINFNNFLDFDDSFLNELLLEANFEFRKNNILLADFFLLLAFIRFAYINPEYKDIIQGYLILRNVIKSFMVQQHRRADFSYFSSFSRSSLKHSRILKEYTFIFNSLRQEFKGTKLNVELRVSIPQKARDMDKIIRNINNYFSYFNKNLKTYKKRNNIRYNIVFSIKKEKDAFLENYLKKDKNSSVQDLNKHLPIPRWENLRNKLKKYIFELRKFLEFYDSSKYLAGLDVASNENFAPPEVFAKLYRYFKISHNIKNLHRDTFSRQNLMFTYHVGEDFDNILTGIRRVYESIIFFRFGKGDRLSHLFSLGVNPKLIRTRRDMTLNITNQDLLDNLVFLYFFLKHNAKLNFKMFSYLDKLKLKAQNLLDEFLKVNSKANGLGLIDNVSLSDYYESWLLRRNCPVEFLNFIQKAEIDFFYDKNRTKNNLLDILKSKREQVENIYEDKYYLYASLPDIYIEKIDDYDSYLNSLYQKARRNPKAIQLYWLYNYDIDWKLKGLTLAKEPIIIEDFIIEKLQDTIMDVIADKDIIVEVLLTSNMLIAPLKDYDEHPILRFLGLKGKRRKPLKVVLGSDNPGIQETNILNEYAILHKMISRYKSKKESFNIIKEIIDNSNNLFKKRYI